MLDTSSSLLLLDLGVSVLDVIDDIENVNSPAVGATLDTMMLVW